MQNRIFSTTSAKAIKAGDFGYLNAIHYLAPASSGGVGNLCSHASAGCIALCLGWFSGQASMVADLEHGNNSVRESRRTKARRFMHDRKAYLVDMIAAIESVIREANRKGLKLCIRLNGSSDIAWESIRVDAKGNTLFLLYPNIPFVDYTKNPLRFNRKLPANYHLTFSRSETNEPTALELLARGVNVAVVFGSSIPATWNGFTVINGDEHDLRHLDPRGSRGYVIGLSPKGNKAKRDTSGFVVR